MYYVFVCLFAYIIICVCIYIYIYYWTISASGHQLLAVGGVPKFRCSRSKDGRRMAFNRCTAFRACTAGVGGEVRVAGLKRFETWGLGV